jgi:NitT/TauT family transport system permease protein
MVEGNALMRHLSQTGWWVASLLLFVGIWELAYGLGLYNSAALPPPHIFLPDLPAQAQHFDTAHLVAGAEFAGSNLAALVQTTGATVLRVLVGLTLGFILGVTTGLAICYFRIFGWLTLPLITLLAPISPFAWLPVAVFIAGVGNAAAIFLVFIAVYFIIVLGTIAEIRAVPATLMNVARTMGATPFQTYYYVVIPAILPALFMILRLNLFAAWMVVLIGESAGVGSGLGAVILLARNTGNMNLVFLGLIVIGVVGVLLDQVLRQVQKNMLYWIQDKPLAVRE